VALLPGTYAPISSTPGRGSAPLSDNIAFTVGFRALLQTRLVADAHEAPIFHSAWLGSTIRG
jgi:hypothetical protein